MKYNPNDKFFTAEELANILGVTPRTIRNWTTQMHMPSHTFCGEYRYLLEELVPFFEKHDKLLK
jgi:excisionase family DNA binding protein